jgi:hypothetical protein
MSRLKCKICSSSSEFFARARLLDRHDVAYYRCSGCGFVQTEEPYWLDEAYSDAINRSDVGLVRRNLRQAKIVRSIIATFFRSDGKFIDYGGGYGLLTRLLRDGGFDFYRYDPHCENIFARDFEAENKGLGYELLTAFELFEHLVNPLDEVRKMLGFSGNIFFVTQLLPAATPKPDEWWYYGLDHGQHVSFYTQRSLSTIAETFSLNLYSDGTSRHLLTAGEISPLLFNAVSKYKVATVLDAISRRKSLIPADYRKVTGRYLPGGEA